MAKCGEGEVNAGHTLRSRGHECVGVANFFSTFSVFFCFLCFFCVSKRGIQLIDLSFVNFLYFHFLFPVFFYLASQKYCFVVLSLRTMFS